MASLVATKIVLIEWANSALYTIKFQFEIAEILPNCNFMVSHSISERLAGGKLNIYFAYTNLVD